jgi:hypothetical protein
MGVLRTPQTNFGRGEIDPQLTSRTDVRAYFAGARKARNVSLLSQGGVRRKPGTRFLYDLGTPNAVLADFVFNDDQLYLFAFVHQALKVFNIKGALLATVTGCPWTADKLDQIYWAQAYDTMFVVHPDFVPQKILRTGASSFARSDYAYETTTAGLIRQPYYKHAADEITLTPSATTGNINCTLSQPYWQAAHAGMMIRYKGKQIRINSITSSTVAACTVKETLPATTADVDWDEPAFSSIYGYPKTVAFHARRLCFGGSKSIPDGFWASQPDAYFNFDEGTAQDGDAIASAIGGEQVNEIRALVSSRHLQIYTDIGSYYVPQSASKPFAPANFSVSREAPYGITRCRPVEFDGATVFIHKGANVVREFLYDDVSGGYTANSVSLLSGHLLNAPKQIVTVLSSAEQPHNFAFVLNGDGTLAQFQSVRAEEVAGWALWETDGAILSVASVGEILFLLAKRTVNGVDKYYIERAQWEDHWTLDCALDCASAQPTTTFSGLGHLAGQTVDVVNADRQHLGRFTVDGGGQIVLDDAVTQCIVGFASEFRLETLPPEADTAQGPIAGQPKHIVSAKIDIEGTYSMTVDGERLEITHVTDDLSQPPTAAVGRVEFYPDQEWEIDPTVTITQGEPLPITVKGLVVEFEV